MKELHAETVDSSFLKKTKEIKTMGSQMDSHPTFKKILNNHLVCKQLQWRTFGFALRINRKHDLVSERLAFTPRRNQETSRGKSLFNQKLEILEPSEISKKVSLKGVLCAFNSFVIFFISNNFSFGVLITMCT